MMYCILSWKRKIWYDSIIFQIDLSYFSYLCRFLSYFSNWWARLLGVSTRWRWLYSNYFLNHYWWLILNIFLVWFMWFGWIFLSYTCIFVAFFHSDWFPLINYTCWLLLIFWIFITWSDIYLYMRTILRFLLLFHLIFPFLYSLVMLGD